MAITTTRNTRSQYTQEFTSSGTWTAPSGVTQVEVLAVGGGGGGGGGGASVQMNAGAGGYGSAAKGGGGGGGGEVVVRKLAVVPNTSYAVTIGAGGTGGQVGTSTANILYNAFLDGTFRAGNTTGWSATNATLAYNATAVDQYGGSLALTPSSTNYTLTYDSGTGTSIPFSTIAGHPFVFGYQWQNVSGSTANNIIYAGFSSLAWYNGTTLLRTDVLETTMSVNVGTNNYSHNAVASNDSNSSTQFSPNWGLTAFQQGVPATATRFILTLSSSIATGVTWRFDSFYLGSAYYLRTTRASTNNVAHDYVADATGYTQGLAWAGTTNASPTLIAPPAGQFISTRHGRRGATGSNGGNTSFGSLLTVLGGGGGGGGGAGIEGAQIHAGTVSDTWYNYVAGCRTGDHTMIPNNQGNPRDGANGGGAGGYSTNTANPDGSANFAGCGGGGMGGWYKQIQSRDASTIFPQGGLMNYASAGYRGYGGSANNTSSPRQFADFSGSLGGQYAAEPTYSVTIGAEGLLGYGYGGNGGGGGGVCGLFTTVANTETQARTGQYEVYQSNFLNANGGLGGTNGIAGTNGGAPQAGQAGANATIYGSGGGGGGGAGAPSTTTNGGGTYANGANGGAGGNGASGYLLISWWE